MQSGSLTIGGTNADYGTATGWTSNTAGLMMECDNYTEIVVHDNNTRLASLMYYDGVYNKIYIGRNKGWGVTQTEISGNFTMPCDRWIYSGDALRTRLYYETNGTSYYQGYGSDYAAAHQWRNRDGTWVMSLNNLGDLSVTGQFNCQLYTISYSYHDMVGVYLEDSQVNQFGNYQLKVIQGTFTGFHRVFTEDELFNTINQPCLPVEFQL